MDTIICAEYYPTDCLSTTSAFRHVVSNNTVCTETLPCDTATVSQLLSNGDVLCAG